MTKQIEVTIRARNNLLIEARKLHGYQTQRAAADAIGMSPLALNGFECFRTSPIRLRDGEWSGIALRIADFYGVSPQALWPKALQGIARSAMPVFVAYVDAKELLAGRTPLALPCPDEAMEEKDKKEVIKRLLDTMEHQRDAKVIRLYLGFDGDDPLNLDEISGRLGIGRERVRQIYQRGLRNLKEAGIGVVQ